MDCLLRSGLVLLMSKASLRFSKKADLTESKILKHDSEYWVSQEDDFWKCLKMCEFLSVEVCSFILVEKWRVVSPM